MSEEQQTEQKPDTVNYEGFEMPREIYDKISKKANAIAQESAKHQLTKEFSSQIPTDVNTNKMNVNDITKIISENVNTQLNEFKSSLDAATSKTENQTEDQKKHSDQIAQLNATWEKKFDEIQKAGRREGLKKDILREASRQGLDPAFENEFLVNVNNLSEDPDPEATYRYRLGDDPFLNETSDAGTLKDFVGNIKKDKSALFNTAKPGMGSAPVGKSNGTKGDGIEGMSVSDMIMQGDAGKSTMRDR